MCNKRKLRFFELQSILLTQDQATYTLGNNSTVANAKNVWAFRVYYSFTGTIKDPDGNTLLAAAVLRSMYLEISDAKNEKPITIPLTELAQMPNTDNPADFLELDLPTGVNPSKCKIISGDAANIVTGTALLIGIAYEPQ